MRFFATYSEGLACAATVAVMLAVLPGCKKAVHPAAAVKAATATKTNAPVAAGNELAKQYVSVFDDSLPPDKGRDPFFPDSTRRNPAPTTAAATTTAAHVDPVFKLGGVVGGPGKRLAVINNNYIVGVGEEAEVRVPTGKVRIHVVEIGEDYVVITVDGETGQKRLDMYQANR